MAKEDLKQSQYIADEEAIGKIVLDAAFKVHTALGPGLLESIYEAALTIELTKRGLSVQRQKPVPVYYEGELLAIGFRADLLVEGKVLVELKSVETMIALFKRITTNYVRLLPVKLGFLINFNEVHLKDGICRVVNGIEGKPMFNRRAESLDIDLKHPSLPSRPSRDHFPEGSAPNR
jgi:GxxExxY protein